MSLKLPRFSVQRTLAWPALALALLAGCGSRDPFPYQKISGKVTYEDGTLIPVPPGGRMEVRFTSLAKPIDAKTHPRPGSTSPDPATGEFGYVTTMKFSDGVVRGQHKITVGVYDASDNQVHTVIPQEYTDVNMTPLVYDTEKDPKVLDLKIKKPT